VLASVDTWAADALAAIGYPALAALMLASPPIPSEVILPLAGFFVGQGELVFPLALTAATLGAIGNAIVVYALARWGGRPLLLRRGGLLRLDERKLDKADRWFARHGARVVVVGRMMSVVRWLVGIPAGAAKMPLGRYAFLTGLGCAGWNSLLMTAGWAIGKNHAQAGHVATIGSLALLTAGLLVAVTVVIRRRRRFRLPEPSRERPSRTAELIKAGYEAFNRGGPSAVVEYLDADVEWQTRSGVPEEGTYKGHDEVRKYLQSLLELFEDVRVELEGCIDAGDRVVAFVRYCGRGKGSEAEVAMREAHVWHVRGDKAIRREVYVDRAAALEAVGKGTKSSPQVLP
jgi:membrane protein DedA with SNARE-associated domain/ketosteroid isomerase-like protein